MGRKKVVAKREIIPDPKFHDVVVTKFVNALMKGGKKSVAEGILYGAFDIIQPDASICGGVAAVLRIGAAAAAQGVACIPHACNGAINLAATLQALAVLAPLPEHLEAGPLLEHDFGENPIRTDLLATPLAIEDGWIAIPDGPGLGVEVDEGVMAALRV